MADYVSGFSSGVAAAGIVAGAFGSHGLQKRSGMTPDKLHAWQTASSYAVSLLAPRSAGIYHPYRCLRLLLANASVLPRLDL